MTKRLLVLGVILWVPYFYVVRLQDLRKHTLAFEVAFFVAFAVYAGVTVLALRSRAFPTRTLLAVFALAAAMQAMLLFTPPTLSDDMYRYVWDGRVQSLGTDGETGISPYLYPPDAPQLASLRDRQIWLQINRKSAVTVYPPAAQMAFAILWRIWPDNIRWFQFVMAAAGLLAGGLLVGLLKDLGRSAARVLIYLWSPLLAFETAHSAHIDALVLPLLVSAWWARLRQRDSLVGILLGLATAIKLYPALLFPALWRPRHRQGRWRMPLAFAITLSACYFPYLVSSDAQVIGFLPKYLREIFNTSPFIQLLYALFKPLNMDPRQAVSLLMLASLVMIGFWMILRPAKSAEVAIRRSVWVIAAFTLLSQNLFSWYMLWLLPLVAIFMQPGKPLQVWRFSIPTLRLDAWTGWWLFTGLVGLSYTFFIDWVPVPLAIWGQYLPLYVFLLIDLGRKIGISEQPGWLSIQNWVARANIVPRTKKSD
jgi:alpha-1,6-mannosyltransferase